MARGRATSSSAGKRSRAWTWISSPLPAGRPELGHPRRSRPRRRRRRSARTAAPVGSACSPDMPARRDRRVLLAFLAVVVLGGTNLVLVVDVTRHLDPLWGAALRFLGAALLTLLVVGVLRAPLPRGRVLAVSALYGVLAFALSFGLFFWGTRHVPAGIASVIIGSVPLLTFQLAVLQRLEPFRVRAL